MDAVRLRDFLALPLTSSKLDHKFTSAMYLAPSKNV